VRAIVQLVHGIGGAAMGFGDRGQHDVRARVAGPVGSRPRL
jgi:hypothetical protein